MIQNEAKEDKNDNLQNYKQRKVVCIETQEVFASAKAAASYYDLAYSYFQRCLRTEQAIKKLGLSFKFME